MSFFKSLHAHGDYAYIYVSFEYYTIS